MPAGEYLNQEKTYLSAFWGTASFHHVIYLTTLEVRSVLLAEIFFVDDAWSDCMIFIFFSDVSCQCNESDASRSKTILLGVLIHRKISLVKFIYFYLLSSGFLN